MSLEDFNSGLSPFVCFGIGPVGMGLDLHVDVILLGSRAHPGLLPGDEREKQLAVSPILIPGLLSRPVLL